jgi:hypothetical protein
MEINCIRRTKRLVAADLTISEGGVEVKYGVYLQNTIDIRFVSADRGRAELAARLLRLMGVGVEVKRMGNGAWYVVATTDRIAAGREELRRAVAEIVKAAAAAGWVNRDKAERWLRKLEGGRALKEGWPKYNILTSGSLAVRYTSTNPGNIRREARRLAEIGLIEGFHFTVKIPKGKAGYLLIRKEGLVYAAWLSTHGSGKQRRLAAEFVNYILQKARERGEVIYEKALKIVKRGER